MEVKLKRISWASAYGINPLYKAYVREMVGERGLSTLNEPDRHLGSLAKYWDSTSHWPYWICASDEVAGFCLVRIYPGERDTHDIEQFFIRDEFRRRGAGTEALGQILGRHPGNWLVRVLKTNEAARLFWCRAVERCVGNAYQLSIEQDEDLEMHFVRFRADNL